MIFFLLLYHRTHDFNDYAWEMIISFGLRYYVSDNCCELVRIGAMTIVKGSVSFVCILKFFFGFCFVL